LIELDLTHNHIGDSTEPILNMLEHSKTIKTLKLSFNDFTEDGIVFVAKGVLWNQTLRHFEFSNLSKSTDKTIGKICKGFSKH